MSPRTVHLTTAAPERIHPFHVSLNRRAAARYDRIAQPLSSVAREHLQSLGLDVASTVRAVRLLSDAVRTTFPAANAIATARAYGASVRELLRTQADLDGLSNDSAPRVRQVANVAARYRTLLRQHALVDGAEVLAVAAQSLRAPGPMTLYGYVRLTTDELQFLNTIAGEGSDVYLPWATHTLFDDNARAAAWLEERGWQVQRDETPPHGLAAALLGAGTFTGQARACSSPEEEVRAALADIKRLSTQGVSVQDIALVVNDDATWGPLVQAVAWEYDVPVDVTASVPLAATSVGTWLIRALEVTQLGLTFERVTRLLGHPLDQGLDGARWQGVRQARPESLEDWRESGVLLDAFLWPDLDTRAGWVTRLTTLLEEREVTRRAAERAPIDSAALGALQTELRVLADPPNERLSLETFAEELRTLLALLAVAPEATGAAVELLTPYALTGAAVPHVLVLGVTEGVWPPPLQDDPLLDFAERIRLRAEGFPLEVPGTLARREMLSFWSLLNAATTSLTLSYGRLTPSGAEALPSAYLTRLGAQIEPHTAVTACSAEELRRSQLQQAGDDDVLPHARHAHEVERRREAEPTFDEYDGLTRIPVDHRSRVFSAGQLRTLGTCTFRWWLSYLLGLEAQEDDEDESLGLGQLQHTILRHLAQHALKHPDQDARSVMLDALDLAFMQAEAELGWPQTPEWQRQRPEVRARLEKLLQAPAFLAPNATIVDAEVNFESTWQGFRVRGQVDRIDRLNDKLVVIDYKRGKSRPWGAQDTDRKLTLDLQLPVYLQAALPTLHPQESTGGAHYLSIKSGEVVARVSLNETAFEAFATRARTALQEGAFVPSPDVQGKACTRCPFPPVCRAGPRLERKVAP